MKCGNCQQGIAVMWNSVKEPLRFTSEGNERQGWQMYTVVCPECDYPHCKFVQGSYDFYERVLILSREGRTIYSHFADASSPEVENELPSEMADISKDSKEARAVLPHSANASAVLSRRALETILIKQGYKGKSLGDLIKEAHKEEDKDRILPLSIRKSLHIIREWGNFAAHGIRNTETEESVNVEEWQAEWCLRVVEKLLEHYYIGPAKDAEQLEAINEKLSEAGKPPIEW